VAAVILFPAIDLKGGQCVRLKRGLMSETTVFNRNPAAQARTFQEQGFTWLHCVDLDGAFKGRAVNADAIEAIRIAVDIPIQLGGGIRNLGRIESWLEAGIARVVLGTAALTDPAFVREAARRYPGQIAVAADAKDGRIATHGWAKSADLTPVELGKRFEDAGVAAILFTDINADGLMGGLNVGAVCRLARALAIPVIASGGVRGIEDIEALIAASEANIEGVIIGRALYEGRINPKVALQIATNLGSP
jgi:phosphoribosylformimino-5-aminoimidazole carboxamide ribotide isomerase